VYVRTRDEERRRETKRDEERESLTKKIQKFPHQKIQKKERQQHAKAPQSKRRAKTFSSFRLSLTPRFPVNAFQPQTHFKGRE
jgi:hypothetical protein